MKKYSRMRRKALRWYNQVTKLYDESFTDSFIRKWGCYKFRHPYYGKRRKRYMSIINDLLKLPTF